MNMLRSLWGFRSYVLGSVGREFRLRYLGSVLGASLVFLIPAFQIALYVTVFGNLLKGRLPGNPTVYGYSIYLCAGILFWAFFSELLQRTQTLYLDNANLIKKASFPRVSLVAVVFLSTSANLFLALGVLLVFLLLTGAFPGIAVLGLVPIWLTIAAVALVIGLNIAILQVFFKDFATLTSIAMQTLFWGTPIVYPVEILPDWIRPWLLINPLAGPVAAAQSLVLGSELPPPQTWISTVLVILLAGIMAWRLYQVHQSDLLDNL